MKLQGLLVAGSLLILLAYWLSPVRLAYTFDRSLEHKWWIEVFLWGEPEVGDYVLLKPPVENEYTKGKYLVKKVVCVKGQRVKNVGLDYYCDGAYLGTARREDSRGRPVEPVEIDRILREGEYFVMGESERSYDSRYFGVVRKEHLVRFMIPLGKSPDLDFLFLKRAKIE